MIESAEQGFPRVACWVDGYGWVEIGRDGQSRSFIRVLNEGGMIWEGVSSCQTLDAALAAADNAIAEWVIRS